MRLDQHLTERGLVRSRERAKAAIQAGLVRVNGEAARKASQTVGERDVVTCEGEAHPYVSRAALKLVAGLDAFGIDPAGRTCLDLGASTGGFTQVLLERHAARVFAVDVGHGQLDEAVAGDPRVVNLERTHAKDLDRALVPDPIEVLVCDVSFIGLRKALPPALALCAQSAAFAVLFKPQFEVGPRNIGRGGIVSLPHEDQRAHAEAAAGWLRGEGWMVAPVIQSPILGGDGNGEFLIGGRRG